MAVPLVLQEDLATSRAYFASLANDESVAYQLGAGELLRTTVEDRGGRIILHATLTSTSTQRNRDVIDVEGPSSAGFLPPLNALAKRLDERATAFSTGDDRALQAFAGAAQAPDAETRVRLLTGATGTDPAFGLAYCLLAETAAQAGAPNVSAVIARASPHRTSFTSLDRARWDALVARFSNAPLAQQASAQSNILQLASHDLDALAALGSIRFLQNDSAAGQRLFTSALQVSPGNLNLRRQLAEGLLETRKFTEAENIFQGLTGDPSILPELAVCILLEGDLARANTVFNKYLALRASNDPLSTLIHSAWLSIAGPLQSAIDLLHNAPMTNPVVRSIAGSQIAVFQLLQGDISAAQKSAAQAVKFDPRPASFASVAALLADAESPPTKWQDRVSASPLSDQPKMTLLAYGFFLHGHFAEAAGEWRQVSEKSGGADLRARAMLAASLDRAGDGAAARKIVVQPFIPDLGDLYAPVCFGEMRRLLGLRTR